MDAVPPGPPSGAPRRELRGGLREPAGRSRGVGRGPLGHGSRHLHRDELPDLGLSILSPERVRHPGQLLEPEPDHRRLEQHQRQRLPGPVLLAGRRSDLGPDLPARLQRRRVQLRPHRGLELRRHRVVLDDGDQQHRDDPQGPDVQVDGPGADLDLRRDDLRLPDQHGQADGLDRPQRHVALQGQHLRHLAQREPGLHEPAERDRLARDADPGEREPDDGDRHRLRREDELLR